LEKHWTEQRFIGMTEAEVLSHAEGRGPAEEAPVAEEKPAEEAPVVEEELIIILMMVVIVIVTALVTVVIIIVIILMITIMRACWAGPRR